MTGWKRICLLTRWKRIRLLTRWKRIPLRTRGVWQDRQSTAIGLESLFRRSLLNQATSQKGACTIVFDIPHPVKVGAHGKPPLLGGFLPASESRTGRTQSSKRGIVIRMTSDSSIHVSVMPREIVAALDPRAGGVYVDGTLGGGGHTRLIAEAVGNAGKVVAIDRDPAALARAEIALKGLPVLLAHGNFDEIPVVLRELQIDAVDGVVLDLGLSSDQLADRERGFSFDSDGELDMRFDPTTGEPAWRLLSRLREDEIADLIYQLGEERYSRRIAREIVAVRRKGPLKNVREFADLVRRCVPRGSDRIDPATRTFQALRIAVNDELGSLRRVLAAIPGLLRPGGTIAVLSFHSLEDRIVKEAFRGDARLEVVTKKPLMAQEDEVAANPRSRSAKLRVARRAPE